MKIADLDKETRAIIYWAHIVTSRPSEFAMGKLKDAVSEHDIKHEIERTENLIRALFDAGSEL